MQEAVDTRTVDKVILFQVAGGRVACTLVTYLLSDLTSRIGTPLTDKIRQYYSVHVFKTKARMDVPTFADSAIRRQLDCVSSFSVHSVCWDTIIECSNLINTLVKLASQISVLVNVLHDQPDGPVQALLCFGHSAIQYFAITSPYLSGGGDSRQSDDLFILTLVS